MKRHAGTVTWFDQTNGYGFLSCGHEADVFADTDSIDGESRYLLKRGDSVQFDMVDTEVGPQARSVARLAFSAVADARSTPSGCFDDAATSRTDEPGPNTNMPQILLVLDDNDRLRALKDEFLTAAGYFVVACRTIQSAAEVYGSGLPIDLVVVDLRPSHGPASLLHELNFLGRSVPVLLSHRTFTPALWSEVENRGWQFLEEICPLPLLLLAIQSMLRPARMDAA